MAERHARKPAPRLTLIVDAAAPATGAAHRRAPPEPALVEIVRLLARQIGDELEAKQLSNEQRHV